jgi:hypothetical protein
MVVAAMFSGVAWQNALRVKAAEAGEEVQVKMPIAVERSE